MSTLSLRNELVELITREKNASVLQVLKDILSSNQKNALLKAKLTSRALKAEADRDAGRVLSAAEVKARLAARGK